MVKIIIENLGQKELTVSDGSKSALHHLHANFVDWMHACGGKGRCTTCKMIILEGEENLTAESPAERKYREDGQLAIHERLACQARVRGDVRIRVAEEYKLPHVRYSDQKPSQK